MPRFRDLESAAVPTKGLRGAAALAFLLFSAGCDLTESGTYTLYRTSALDAAARIHIATFDTKEGAEFNADYCQTAAKLLMTQPGVTVRYWCEAGRYRPKNSN